MEKPPDSYKGVKVPIKYIVKQDDTTKKILETVVKANKIVIHTLQFMKLYLIHYYDNHQDLPIIDKVFVNTCMKVVCIQSTQGRPPSQKVKILKEELSNIFEKYYKPFMNDELDYRHMNTILDYLTIDILTMYENNVKQHYIEYVERYVNIVWKKKKIIELIRKKRISQTEKEQRVNKMCSQLRKIKNDILTCSTTSLPFYHSWIKQQRDYIIPSGNLKKDNVYYDLQCDPHKYLSKMIFMMKEIEKHEEKISNVFPLRSNIIPKHIRLDTTTLVQLLFTDKQGKKSDYLTEGNLKKNEDKIWRFFFRTERKCFNKKDYSFHHMIETDGVSCTILLLRKDLVGKRVSVNKKINSEIYIDEIKKYKELKDKKIVAIDPNMSDLLYCVDRDTRERNHLRYTQNQRKKETKQKKYSDILDGFKNEIIEGKSVIEWETLLSNYNRKTLILSEYIGYVKVKNEINKKLYKFYENYLFRKLKLSSYTNRRKSEQKFINNFRKIFGEPENVIIGIGDFKQRKHRKFKEPVKGKGFRDMFQKSGYNVYLVDEFRTSCKCSNCEGQCSTFRKCKSPRHWRDELITRHGLLMCKTCRGLWNRDENSSRNIYKIISSHINGLERPEYMRRNFIGITSISNTQNLHSLK
jgi:hypothetical protein